MSTKIYYRREHLEEFWQLWVEIELLLQKLQNLKLKQISSGSRNRAYDSAKPKVKKTMLSSTTINCWIAHSKPNPLANLRLFCFPYAGGSAQGYRTWAEGLPTTIEVCPIELPGRGTRLTDTLYYTRVLPLVEAIAAALLPLLDKPFAFFGHSMGALIAFELTRLLRREYGLIPVHLFVSGRDAPQIKAFHQPESVPTYALPEHEFLEKLRLLSGTPNTVLENAELMQLIIPILRADWEVSETYVYTPEPLLECPITAFGGLQDPVTSHDELEAWREQTSVNFSLHMFPGNHFFLNTAQPLLLRVIARSL